MKKGAIYYFSGTGNTDYVAAKLKDEFEKKGVSLELLPLDFIDKADIEEYDILGFGFPVYAFSSPSIFKSFRKALPRGNGKKAFVFCTNAGGAGKAEIYEAKCLKRKGYNVLGAFDFFKLPGNFFYSEKVEVKEDVAERVAGIAKNTAEAVTSETIKPLKFRLGLIPFLASKAFDKFYAGSFAKKKFYVNKDCTLCRGCVQFCPAGNISIIDNNVVFGSKCIVCMRCLNHCPVNAIKHKGKSANAQAYKGISGKYSPPRNKA